MKYSEEEKKQLLINLDIEVQHRASQFQAWLKDQLLAFNMHQENTISRIPKPVRAMTMREFSEKYHGNPVVAVTGSQRERLAGDGLGEIDKTERKRKWMAIQETADADVHGEARDGESSRNSKSARLASYVSPKKKAGSSMGPGTAQRARILASGGSKSRVLMDRIPGSPSPQKTKPPFSTSTRPPQSPSKLPHQKAGQGQGQSRSNVPSSSTFNPVLPAKTPTYPRHPHHQHTDSATLRLPRPDESMLSLNGSPLANPFSHSGHGTTQTLKRTQSNISIRRDPSFISGLPPRADSQSSFYAGIGGTSSKPHSRNNSDATLAESTSSSSFETPYPLTKKYTVSISTKDGHILEFDPLQTSPKALDALEGITDSAKKQAREEMGRLVEAAVDKWKIR